MCPVLDSPSFAPILMLPHRTWIHSASGILAVCISCRNIAVFVFRKALSIKLYHIYICYMNIVMYSVWYSLWFHITIVGLGTYHSRIREHTCTEYYFLFLTYFDVEIPHFISHNRWVEKNHKVSSHAF
jgi:hypothetical protein